MLTVPVFLLVVDFVAILATWMKTYQHVRQATSLGMPTVAKILLRDGVCLSYSEAAVREFSFSG